MITVLVLLALPVALIGADAALASRPQASAVSLNVTLTEMSISPSLLRGEASYEAGMHAAPVVS